MINHLFDKNTNQVFYGQQIEILLENERQIKILTGVRKLRFYHWITEKALRELGQEGLVSTEKMPLGVYRKNASINSEASSQTSVGTEIRFYWSKKLRYWKRHTKELRKIVRSYSNQQFGKALGRHGEIMFDAALPKMGFLPKAENVKKNGRLVWEETNHNLDRIYALREGWD